jgi:hypothetical protein
MRRRSTRHPDGSRPCSTSRFPIRTPTRESKWFVITQERVEQLAKSLEIEPPSLNLRAIYKVSPQSQDKITKVDEARAASGMAPMGDDRGELLVSELDAPAETTKVVEGEKDGTSPEGETADDAINGQPSDPGASQEGPDELASDATNHGGSTTGADENGAASPAGPG